MVERFRENKQTIEDLRTELCRIWGPDGGTLATTWAGPELSPVDTERLRAMLLRIPAENISVSGENCVTGIQAWSGVVVDFTQFRMLRWGGISFERELPISDLAPCDCVGHVVPLDDGWLLRVASYTWIS